VGVSGPFLDMGDRTSSLFSSSKRHEKKTEEYPVGFCWVPLVIVRSHSEKIKRKGMAGGN
jgi:hypothetical protein